MTNLLFQCSSCPAYLVVDSATAGQIIECPECKQRVLVPEASCTFQCGHCHAGLAAPAGMTGKVIECPECSGKTTIPLPVQANTRIHVKSSTPLPRLCPYCGTQIAQKATLCISCGTNLQTGRQYGLSNTSASSQGNSRTTDFFAIVAFSTGLLSVWILPIVFAPICYVSSLVSYYRLKKNANLKGTGLRITGALLGIISLIWLFNFWGIRELWQDSIDDNSVSIASNNNHLARKETERLAEERETRARTENEQLSRQQTLEKEQLARQQAQAREQEQAAYQEYADRLEPIVMAEVKAKVLYDTERELADLNKAKTLLAKEQGKSQEMYAFYEAFNSNLDRAEIYVREQYAWKSKRVIMKTENPRFHDVVVREVIRNDNSLSRNYCFAMLQEE